MSAFRLASNRAVAPAALALLLILAGSCYNKDKSDLSLIKALDESVVNSSTSLDQETKLILYALNDRLNDPVNREAASIWYPRAQVVNSYSYSINNYIDSLKQELKKEAGLKIVDGKESYMEKSRDAVVRFFDKRGKGEELYQRLLKYKQDILHIDSRIQNEFNNSIMIVSPSFDAMDPKTQNLTEAFFDHIPVVGALAILNKFENNVKIIENKVMKFCNTRKIVKDFTSLSAIISASSNYIRAGEELEIIGGVGAFSTAASAEMKVNGKNIKVDGSGVARYHLVAPNKPGQYRIRVEITYIDREGRKWSEMKDVEYTVAKE